MAKLDDFQNTDEQKVRKVQITVEFEVDSLNDAEAKDIVAQAINGLVGKAEGNEKFLEQHDKVVAELNPLPIYSSIKVSE